MSTSIYSLTSKRFSSCIFLITLSLWSKGYINVASNRTRQCVLHSRTSNTMAVCLSRARLLDRWKRWKTSGVFPVCNCSELRASGGTRDNEINFGKQFAALVFFGWVTNARYVCTHTRTHSRTHSYTHEHTQTHTNTHTQVVQPSTHLPFHRLFTKARHLLKEKNMADF